MRTICVLLVLIASRQATAAEPRAIDEGQPAWLVAYECFQQAGDLIVAGQYESARQLLLEASAYLPDPYQRRAQSAAQKLPLTGPGNDQLVHAEDFKVQLNDPLGRQAASDPKFDNRTKHDLNWMAGVCGDIEAHTAALALRQRSLNRVASPNTAGEIVDLLYWTHGHPDEAERIIERSGDESLRERWRASLPAWRGRHQHVADPLSRLDFWHGYGPLARMHELESLRPLLTTHEQLIEFECQRIAALAGAGDFESRDECMEVVFTIADDRPELCAELLWNAAELEQRKSNAYHQSAYLRRIVDEYASSARAGRALQRLGSAARRGNDYRELIHLNEQLFHWAKRNAARFDDRDRLYRVDLHQAAIDLSRAYETLDNIDLALQYARMARDEYPSRSACGVGIIEGRAWLHRRISLLEALAPNDAGHVDVLPFEIPQF